MSSRLEGISKFCSFEKAFKHRHFYNGEHELDRCLKSLLNLVDCCEVYNTHGMTVLLNNQNLVKKIYKQPPAIVSLFKSLRKNSENFSLGKFLEVNNIQLDMIDGFFPMVFEDYRLVVHSLRLSWAFYLTLRMKRFSFTFVQRTRKGLMKKKEGNYLSEIFYHILTSFQKLSFNNEKEIIKCIKNSLCTHVSIVLDQEELPQGVSINLVPPHFRGFFRDKLGKEDSVNFFFSLLQSKVLCETVPEDFVLDALVAHQKQLSSEHKGLTPDALILLYKRGQEFGKLVRRFYKPNKGFQPTNKATCHFPREIGGVKGDLVFNGRLKTALGDLDPKDRIEPFVIGLFGQPGQGKSTCLSKLVSGLSTLFPKVPYQDLTYERSCNVDHWDGYNNQPIVILDDLGQKLSGADISEFQILVSCNPYVLPMAELEDKGKYFNSPIIILTSNLMYGQDLSSTYPENSRILDDGSFWRRIHQPIYVENSKYYSLYRDYTWIRKSDLLFDSYAQNERSQRHFASRSGTLDSPRRPISASAYHHVFRDSETIALRPGSLREWEQTIWDPNPIDICSHMIHLCDIYKKRLKFHENIRKNWTQTVAEISDDTGSLIGKDFYRKVVNPLLPTSLFGRTKIQQSDSNKLDLVFPAYPPIEPLPVRVEPIKEPLKVRTITAGKGDTFCLKPFQVAMWKALGCEPQFALTHGTNRLETSIERIFEKSDPQDVWISGDYTAATDSFAIEASKALLEGILESIDHEPTKRWAMKEISPHLLIYPKSSGLEPVLQKSGQLMGSLLSFPLLCLLNDCTAQSVGLHPSKYLINGDDILMRASADVYPQWKDKVQEFGLSLSLGKNYIHPDFGTVNSQLIYKGTVLNAGKQRVLDRRVQVLGECLRDLELFMADTPTLEVHNLFKVINRKKLSLTIRSIDVPLSHGGLSLSWGDRTNISDRSKRTELIVYLHDLFKKIEPEKGCISIPYLSMERLQEQNSQNIEDSFFEFVSSKEYHEDFLTTNVISRVKSRVQGNPHLRGLFLDQKIEDLPPLNFLHTLQIPFSDQKTLKDMQSIIDETFFKLFLSGNTEFTYKLYRQTFLLKSINIKQETRVSTEYLIDVFDRRLGFDFLEKIPVDYVPRNFSSEIFSRDLKKAFGPKEFNLPEIQDTVDFSAEIISDYEEILNCFLGLKDQLNSPEKERLIQEIEDFSKRNLRQTRNSEINF